MSDKPFAPATERNKQAILGVIAKRQSLAWFVKLQGDRDLATQEQKNFEAFVESLQF